MAIKIRHIATRFALILASRQRSSRSSRTASGRSSLQRGTRESIVTGNRNVATRAADEIRRYVVSNAELLKALAADLQNTGLQTVAAGSHPQELRPAVPRVPRDHALRRSGRRRRDEPRRPAAGRDPHGAQPVIRRRHACRPSASTTTCCRRAVFAIHLTRLNQPAGWLVGEFSLEEMWRMVDQIRIGEHGFALVVAPDGALVAHGDPDKKALVAQSRNMAGSHPLVGPGHRGDRPSARVRLRRGRPRAAGRRRRASIRSNWTVIVEQPTERGLRQRHAAPAAARRRHLRRAAGHDRRRPILRPPVHRADFRAAARHAGPCRRASSRPASRSTPATNSASSATPFNSMADRLVELQENVKRQERQAMFGRVVAGLFHDLNHPIQNIGNNARLLLRDDIDAESTACRSASSSASSSTLKRFMDDVLNIAKPRPIERFALDVNSSVGEIVEAMRAEGRAVRVDGDGRVRRRPADHRRRPVRARPRVSQPDHQRDPGDGRRRAVTVTTASDRRPHRDQSQPTPGPASLPDRLSGIFDDFVTTKRRGLGLGLATSKRIVEQLDGTITVESEVGRGTSFTLRFPARDDAGAGSG